METMTVASEQVASVGGQSARACKQATGGRRQRTNTRDGFDFGKQRGAGAQQRTSPRSTSPVGVTSTRGWEARGARIGMSRRRRRAKESNAWTGGSRCRRQDGPCPHHVFPGWQAWLGAGRMCGVAANLTGRARADAPDVLSRLPIARGNRRGKGKAGVLSARGGGDQAPRLGEQRMRVGIVGIG